MSDKYKYEIISKFEMDRNSIDIESYARDIFSNMEFNFDTYEDLSVNNVLVKIQTNKSTWNEKYFLDHIALLNTNFSRERLKHCIELRSYFNNTSSFSKKKIYILIVILLITISISLSLKTSDIDKTDAVKTTLPTKDNNESNISNN